MVRRSESNIETLQITQKLLANITGLFQCGEISAQTRRELAASAKKAHQSKDYTEFLTILERNTKFCCSSDLVENCKRIIYNS